jgi:plastocyanin
LKLSKQKLTTCTLVTFAVVSALLITCFQATTVAAHQQNKHHTWQVQVGAQTVDASIQGMAFLPGAIWIHVGDSIVWTSGSSDMHTVTFPAQGQPLLPFTMHNSMQTFMQGDNHYDGKSYYNSGIMSKFPPIHAVKSYTLTFDVPGSFIYHDLIHPSMIGIVYVRAGGSSLPFTAHDYHNQLLAALHAITQDGQRLAARADQRSKQNVVIDGIGDGRVSVFRFYKQKIVIHVGNTITFSNLDPLQPHTVTYGADQDGGSFAPYGNNKDFRGTEPLNSGYLGTDPLWFGTSYTIRFTKAGTFTLRCDIHDYLGMYVTVVVKN